MVYLEIYKNGVLLKEIVLSPESGSEIDPDYEVKVSLTDILPGNSRDWVMEYYNPWAKVSISLRGKPNLEVKVTTDKIDYISNTDEILKATVELENTGDAVARDVDVDLDPGILNLRGGSPSQFHTNYQELKKAEIQTFEVIFLVPKVVDDISIPLHVRTKGYDVKNLEYKANGSLAVTISPKDFLKMVSINKGVKDRMYLKDTAIIRVTISNSGDFDLYNVHVKDRINENFELKSNSSLYWDIPVIKSGQDWSTTYTLTPLETNLDGFPIPAANVLFTMNNKEYNVSSDSYTIVVNGPKIILNKIVDKQTVNISDDITITVSIKNVGNVATKTQVVDYLPDNMSLVSGQTSIESLFLEVNKPQVFSYVIRPRTGGIIELPAAIANYISMEYKGSVRSALSSNRTQIHVIDPDKINTMNLNTTGTNANLTPVDGQIPVTLPDTTPSIEATSEDTPEITPTPITPFIGTAFTCLLLIVVTMLRRK
jgi:uncharacterized repeat protein (TIGR01451 family)